MTRPVLQGNVTLRQVFDFVKNHLLTQNKISAYSMGSCLYRGPYGSACAVGCLIPDNKYTPTLEGHNLTSLLGLKGKCFSDLFDFTVMDYQKDLKSMLDKLQGIHDNAEVFRWKQELEIMQAEWFG